MVSLSINAATNRITTAGFAYDAAGHKTQWPGGSVTLGADSIDRWTRHYYDWNQFNSATWGRFSSLGPYVMSGGLTNPQGWNRYSYVGNDPVNYNDPTGLMQEAPTFTITVTAPAMGLSELEF